MISFLGGMVDFAFGMVKMAFDLAFGAVEFAFGILGGIASLLFSIIGVALMVLLVVVFIRRRRSRKTGKARQQSDVRVDENGETFTSFYRQGKE